MKDKNEFLRVLAETGSAVQARRAVGATSRAVRKWFADPAFEEQYNDALEAANDAIRAKVREMALAGETSMLALSMKVIEPALRPAGTSVALQVNTAQTVVPDADAERLAQQLNDLLGQLAIRERDQLPVPAVDPGPVTDVAAAGEAIAAGEGLDPSSIC